MIEEKSDWAKKFSENEQAEKPPEIARHKVWDRLILMAKDLLRKDFGVDRDRAQAYYDFDRRDVLGENVKYVIPIGKSDTVIYSGVATGGVIDRDINDYNGWFFGEAQKDAFGSEEETFAPGKVTVDLGSGRAVGLMQLSEKYPLTTIIGFDSLYQEQRRVKPDKAGLQLSYADWENLSGLKNDSVDNIISLQGILMWGVPGVGGRRYEKFDPSFFKKIMNELRRVLKVGGVIKLDAGAVGPEDIDFLKKEMDPKEWEISEYPTLLIARKIA